MEVVAWASQAGTDDEVEGTQTHSAADEDLEGDSETTAHWATEEVEGVHSHSAAVEVEVAFTEVEVEGRSEEHTSELQSHGL